MMVSAGAVAAHDWFCRRVCGHMTEDTRNKVPQQIRDASHELANATAALQGSAVGVRRQAADVMQELARTIRSSGDGGS